MANQRWLVAATLLLSSAPAIAAGPRDVEFQTCMERDLDAVREQHPEWAPTEFSKIARISRPACHAVANNNTYPKNVSGVTFVAPGQIGSGEEAAPIDDTGAELLGSFLTGFLGGYAGGIVRAPHAYAPGPASHTAPAAHIVPVNPRPLVAPGLRPVAPTSAPTVSVGPATAAIGGPSAPAKGGPIGYIHQPNGKLDPYYAKPPCATTVQTGPTSYKCTNY